MSQLLRGNGYSWDCYTAGGDPVNLVYSVVGQLGQIWPTAICGDIKIYKDNSDSEENSDLTDGRNISYDGLNSLFTTYGIGYGESPGHDYTVMLIGATIDGQTVNAIIGSYSVENRSH